MDKSVNCPDSSSLSFCRVDISEQVESILAGTQVKSMTIKVRPPAVADGNACSIIVGETACQACLARVYRPLRRRAGDRDDDDRYHACTWHKPTSIPFHYETQPKLTWRCTWIFIHLRIWNSGLPSMPKPHQANNAIHIRTYISTVR